jgi:hypothetical protein
VARSVVNLNTNCRTLFSLLDEKDVHLMEHLFPVCPIKVKFLILKAGVHRFLKNAGTTSKF